MALFITGVLLLQSKNSRPQRDQGSRKKRGKIMSLLLLMRFKDKLISADRARMYGLHSPYKIFYTQQGKDHQ